ncbi:chloroplast sensor kinase, chloroplastic [Typha latifolia]|uniref:chloroplast sensor kinase, chloroplastic n=1 Tax=Typha latifolia TaxID=4733 RepID=UPI003C2F5AB8
MLLSNCLLFRCTNLISTIPHLHPSNKLPSFGIPNPTAPQSNPAHHHHHSSHLILRSHSPLRPVALPDPNAGEEQHLSLSSAAALAAAIRRASPSSPVAFTQRVEKQGKSGLVMPSPDFQRLCLEQLELFRMVVDPEAILSVYVRPAGSYVMDQLELRRVAFSPGIDIPESAECVILVGNFAIPAGLRAAESAMSKQQVDFSPESGAVVLPMVKHPFVVGFIVAEIPIPEVRMNMNALSTEQQSPHSPPENGSYGLSSHSNGKMWEIKPFKEDVMKVFSQFTTEQRSRAIMISRSLAMAYVMDQKALLLQQTSWQNNVRMSHLVEQIRGPLSSIRALVKMLSVYVKKSEIPYDVIQDILIQGDHMKNALQQIQDAVYLTKANIVRYNEDTLQKMHGSMYGQSKSLTSLLSDFSSEENEKHGAEKVDSLLPLGFERKDIEMSMPPLWLIPLQQHGTRPCNASDVLKDLVDAAVPLANKQQRSLELSETSEPLQVAVEESALRQALSNLIEGALLRTKVGGKVQIYAGGAPAGGALIVIDDDGPDMQYMTQMHSLTPFGADLFSDGMLEDSMTWNFIAGLTVAREILESYGCFVRVISPRKIDAAIGAGGTHIELWLPTLQSYSAEAAQEA